MANAEKLNRTLQAIIDDPDQWNNGVWAIRDCKTTYCFASLTCALEGLEFQWEPRVGDSNLAEWEAERLVDGRLIPDAAVDILELTPTQGAVLFYNELPVDRFAVLVQEVIDGGHLQRPEYPAWA